MQHFTQEPLLLLVWHRVFQGFFLRACHGFVSVIYLSPFFFRQFRMPDSLLNLTATINERPRFFGKFRLSDAASKFLRSQQEKIAVVLEAFVNQHSDREA